MNNLDIKRLFKKIYKKNKLSQNDINLIKNIVELEG